MTTKTFINLPVRDLQRTRRFFAGLGFSFNEQFSDEKAICMIFSEESYAMFLTEAFFSGFTDKPVNDAYKATEVLVALSVDTKEQVNSLMEKALQTGAKEVRDAVDHGFMYSRSFHDLDGHIWELFWMDMNTLPQS